MASAFDQQPQPPANPVYRLVCWIATALLPPPFGPVMTAAKRNFLATRSFKHQLCVNAFITLGEQACERPRCPSSIHVVRLLPWPFVTTWTVGSVRRQRRQRRSALSFSRPSAFSVIWVA